jgi:hypothetical protein
MLIWQKAETKLGPLPCFEAEVSGGKYRPAPVRYRTGTFPDPGRIGYEAYFIPDGAKSMADVRDIVGHLTNIDDAKQAAEFDYDASHENG